jgi:NADH:ubiquinone oxidoreductase subunit F (NADH-binding)
MTTIVEPMTTLGRYFAAESASLADHLAAHGPLPDAAALTDVVAASGLTGRGGAGFPTAVKMRVVAAGDSPIVVGNGAEGEPLSAKDRSLLAYAPHLVLDGLQLAAAAVGAQEVYLAVTGNPWTLNVAVAERVTDRIRVKVVTVPDRFLIGEETALVSALDGGPGLPRGRRIPVWERGVAGRPTLVQNVETLAALALIARHGAAWFRSTGEASAPGTFLASISGAVPAPGVLEVPVGQRLSWILENAGGSTERLSAVMLGGYHGGWLPASSFDVALSPAGLGPLGLSVGSGVVVAFPASVCGLVETARVVSYLAAQSARQCGPCLNGLPTLAARVDELARGHASSASVRELASLVAGRGACHHPDGTVRFVGSALAAFESEVALHAAGRCSATSSDVVLPTPGVS